MLRRGLGAIGFVLLLWFGGLVWFAETLPGSAGDRTAGAVETEAIVVLTGGSGRVTTGLQLLAEHRGDKLFVSGVHPMVAARELIDSAGLDQTVLDCCLFLGYSAETTAGNAKETAAWMRQQGFTSLRLVTANYHMPRSLLEFRMAMPEMVIVPHPVAPAHVHTEDWWRWRGTLRLIVTEYNKYLVVLAGAALGRPG